MDLLESIEGFLSRLDVYTKCPLTTIMTEIILKIMVELLSTLTVVTKQIMQGRPSESILHHKALPGSMKAEKFVKKLLGENDVEAILRRLDRLTLDEARTTSAQSLEAIYGVVQNMRVVMDGEQVLLDLSHPTTPERRSL